MVSFLFATIYRWLAWYDVDTVLPIQKASRYEACGLRLSPLSVISGQLVSQNDKKFQLEIYR